ncbi:hypothetical protein RhiirA4_474808 [Rhizophagus irregularis]|uniref:C17orf113 probable zinc finger domain-containing protein n=1 Tax=Rhizophagus irregularis TaxID=588596 RepID=A0A2I1H961_9GLOM|nr:hypothetical protein RhiirA4_474808 [Rhizophagus irregularis]
MFCTLCIKHKMKNKFATEGAANISKKSVVKEHVKCKDHTDAEKLETARIQMESLQNQIFLSDANVRHIIAVILLPFTIEMMRESETPNISDGLITYTNEISGREFLIVIAKTIEDEIWKELSDVVGFGIMIDESTDIIITKHLDIYVSTCNTVEYNVQRFIDETNPFGNNSVEYMGHNLSFTEQDYDEFLMDVYSYSTSILSELQQRFPNRSLFTSMKILNPQEWPKNSQDLLFFGDDELENLLEYYKHLNIHNNVQCSPLFDVNKCRQEWAGFKLVVSNNLSSKDIDVIFPLLIQDYNDTFPNIIKLIQLVYCIPFSSVECERGFRGPESSKFNYNREYTIWSNQKRRIGVEK